MTEYAQEYLDTIVEITLADGQAIALSDGEHAPAQMPLPFYVLTAWNPASRERAGWVNAVDQSLLEGVLHGRGCETLPALGRDPRGTWEEPGVAAWGLTQEEAIKLGCDFGQNAIFAVTDEGRQLLWCTQPAEGTVER